MSEPISLSPSLEDYLEVIWGLDQQNDTIRVTDLAEKLNVAKSSVNQAVTKLVELQLLRHERYGPLELTALGMEMAKKIRGRHDLLKRFFSDILGVDLETAETDACAIEHYISPVTMEKLIDYLANLLPKGPAR